MNLLTGKFRRCLFRLLGAGLFLSGFLGGCDAEESCISFYTNQYQLGFYSIGENGRPVASPFNFEEVKVIGSTADYFEPVVAGVPGLVLALDPAADTTTFVFEYEEKGDTLKVAYERNFRMISPECGMEIRYSGLEVVSHTFDSVRNITTELSSTDQGFDLAVYSLNPCESPYTDLFRAGFRAIEENGATETDTVNFDAVQAVGNDSIFFARTEAGTDRLRLALNPAADSTIFLFENAGQIDSLIVNYTRIPRIYSPECGLQVQYQALQVSMSTFDSVRLLSTSIPETATQDFDVEIFRFE